MSMATEIPLARLNETQKADFHRDGYLILPAALDADAIARCIAMVDHLDAIEHQHRQMAADEFTEVRNAIAKDHRLLELLTYPTVFPIVADLMGPDISLCTSHALVRPPARVGTPADFKASGWHKDGGAQIPAVHGTCPWLYTKVGFFLTDLSQPGRGNLRVIPGSHLHAAPPGKSTPGQIDPDGAIEVLTKPGDVVIFQQALWHSVGPNTATTSRKNIYLGYSQRWLRPIDFQVQDAELMAKADPIQRQLLGDYASECTFYLPQSDDVPLRPWLDDYRRAQSL